MQGISLLAEELSVSQEGFLSMHLGSGHWTVCSTNHR